MGLETRRRALVADLRHPREPASGGGRERLVALDADAVASGRERRGQRRAGAGERVEDRVAVDREHLDEPERQLEREGRAASARFGVLEILPRAGQVGPDVGEPDVALFPEERAAAAHLLLVGAVKAA